MHQRTFNPLALQSSKLLNFARGFSLFLFALNFFRGGSQEAIRREMDQYREAQQDLVNRENRLFDMFMDGSLDEATYKAQRTRLQAKQRAQFVGASSAPDQRRRHGDREDSLRNGSK